MTSALSPAEALYLRLRTSVSAAASLNSSAFFTAAASFSCSHERRVLAPRRHSAGTAINIP